MRAAPAFQISLRRFGLWRIAVFVFAGLAVMALAAWLSTLERPVGATVCMAAAMCSIAVAGLAVSLAHVPPMNLRWDGLAWHLGRPETSVDDAMAGELAVVIDLGPWMLLRFTPAAPDSQRRPTWIPVQRRGIEAQWHMLRCSVYSPRPQPGADAATEG